MIPDESSIHRLKPYQVRREIKRQGQVEFTSEQLAYIPANTIYSRPIPRWFILNLYKTKDNKVYGRRYLRNNTWLTGCREILALSINKLRRHHSEIEHLSILLYDHKNLSGAVEVLNHYERKYRWGLSFVANTSLSKGEPILVCSKKWGSNPMYVSLLGLILRIASQEGGPKHGEENPEQYLKRMARKATEDGLYLKYAFKAHPDFINIVMKHHTYISNSTVGVTSNNTGLKNTCLAINNKERFAYLAKGLGTGTLSFVDAVSSKVAKYKGKRLT